MSIYTIVIEGNDAEGWGAHAPDLPGLLLAGDTRDDLLARAPEAIADYIDIMREKGFSVPSPGAHIAQVEVPSAA